MANEEDFDFEKKVDKASEAYKNIKDNHEIGGKKLSLEDIATHISKIEDHEKRLTHGQHYLKGVQESDALRKQRREPVIELTAGSKLEDMAKLYKGLHEEKNLKEYNTQKNWMNKFADVIMPTFGMGAGKSKENYNTMILYLEKFDKISGESEGKTAEEVRQLVARGDGHQAAAKILEALQTVREDSQIKNLINLLLPPDDFEHRKRASDLIAKKVNKYLKDKGEEYQVSAGVLGQNIGSVYRSYSHGNFDEIIKYDKAMKKQKLG